MKKNMVAVMRLLQFTDSTFPVGTFSFSNGLETAAYEGIVHNADTLEEYTHDIALQAAYSDGIAALHAFRATSERRYEELLEADRQLILFKMNEEARQMLRRMGKKMAELSTHIFDSAILRQWLEDIRNELSPGTYPVAQGLVFSLAGLSEEDLFCSHQYGVINMVLSAALRCVKVSHYDTQRILFKLSQQSQDLYEEVRKMTFADMNAFVPQIDILASLHEKGNMRMFMN
ncbi:MAG TPA: urease accessory protein UreF [Candidatus Bacteroides intestinigallinarum]|nr:urease accessory protein UreF [Candidatus Bacteroides intestinigallinarum]